MVNSTGSNTCISFKTSYNSSYAFFRNSSQTLVSCILILANSLGDSCSPAALHIYLSFYTALVPQVLWWHCFQNSEASPANLTPQNLKISWRIVKISSWEVQSWRVSEVSAFTITVYISFIIILRHFSFLGSCHSGCSRWCHLIQFYMEKNITSWGGFLPHLINAADLPTEQKIEQCWASSTGLEELNSSSGAAPRLLMVASHHHGFTYCTSWWLSLRSHVKPRGVHPDSIAACAVTVPLVFKEDAFSFLMIMNW